MPDILILVPASYLYLCLRYTPLTYICFSTLYKYFSGDTKLLRLCGACCLSESQKTSLTVVYESPCTSAVGNEEESAFPQEEEEEEEEALAIAGVDGGQLPLSGRRSPPAALWRYVTASIVCDLMTCRDSS